MLNFYQSFPTKAYTLSTTGNTPSRKTATDQVCYPPAYVPDAHTHTHWVVQDPNMDLDIPLHCYKDLIDFIIRQPTKEDTEPPVPLSDLVDMRKLSERELPRQKKFDPIIKLIKSKILWQVHLPTSSRDLHGTCLHSPYFRVIYPYCNIRLHIMCKRSHKLSDSRQNVVVRQSIIQDCET